MPSLRPLPLAVVAFCTLAMSAKAQNTYVPSAPDNMLTPADPIGVPPHVSTTGTNETINLSNGGLTVFVPALTLPQRGGWNITLGYFHDSNTWALRQDLTNVVSIDDDNSWGDEYTYDEWLRPVSPSWQVNLPTLKTSIEYVGDITASNELGMQAAQAPVFCVMNFAFTDWSGNQHTFTNTAECSATEWQGFTIWNLPTLANIVPITDSTDGSWLKLNTSNLSNIQVTTKDGTAYSFTGYQVIWPASGTPYSVHNSSEQCADSYCSTFHQMVDTNGDVVTYNSSTGVLTDAVGRNITISSTGISYTDSNGNPDTISLSTTTSGSSMYNFPSFSCIAQKGHNAPWSDTINVHTTSGVNLPVTSTTTLTFPATDSTGTPRVYTMQFNQLGQLVEIQYPSGGYTQYDYQTESFAMAEGQNSCSGLTMWEIKDKYECTISSGCSPSPQYQSTYAPTLQSGTYNGPPFNGELVETDLTTGNYTQHDFGISIQYANYAPKETHTYYYNSSGTLLRDVQTAYIPTSCTNLDMELPGTITTTLDDVSPSISSQEVLQYESFTGYEATCGTIDNETEIDEYDYGASSPTRKTAQTWMSGSNSSLYTDSGTHLLDRLESRTVTDPSTNDQHTLSYGYNSVGDITSKVVGGTGVTSLTTSYQRDSYGNITQMTDPKNNVTNFGYTDNWADSACSNLNPSAYLTSITDALNHVSKFSYYSCTGLKESAQNPNDIAASRPGTTFTYDALGRPRITTRPDTGTTTNTYVDSTTNGNSVTVASSITTSLNKTQETILDGFGRKVHSVLTSDPDNPDTVDTTYDSLGRVASVSNPYRTTSDSTYGITYYKYDALDRTLKVTQPDGANSVVTTVYSGNQTTVTDEAGKQRKSQTDALGRLTDVWENPSVLNYETTYAYDAFGNLDSVLQNGSRQRTFSYNAFSQLLSAANPESGTIAYTYDNDGNLLTKVSYAQNQTDGTPTYGTGSVSVTLSRTCQEGDCGTGTATISVGSYGAQVNYTLNESTSSLASALANQLNFSSLVTASTSGSTVLITSKVSGPSGNYSLSASAQASGGGPPVSYVLTPSGSTLTGGSSPPTVTITYAYDALNRLTKKTYTDGTPTVTYWYDGSTPSGCSPTLTYTNPIYERTAMCDGPGWEAWTYNPTGHVTNDWRSTSSLAPQDTVYVPNLDGSDASITYPVTARQITYTYDTAGRPSTAADVSNGINYVSGPCSNGASGTGACYAPHGALAYAQNGTNLYTTEIYNNRLQPCWIYATTGSALTWNTTRCSATDPGPANILDLQFNLNWSAGDDGNVIGITNNRDTTRSQAFSYDALNRLLTAETTSTYSNSSAHCWGEAYFYDNQPSGSGAWGNLTSIGVTSSPYNGCTQEGLSVTATTDNQISGYCYDAAGNLLQESTCPAGPPYTFKYNAENQMTSTAGVTYSYDGDGKRAEKSGGKIYWYGGGADALDETDLSGDTNNSTFSEYVYFGGSRTARRDYQGNIFYYFSDHLGTSREMVQSGQTSPCYDADFYPFGGERAYTATCTQNYKFTGKERDTESNLDDFGARYDSSSLGRFVSPDSTAYVKPINPQGWNLYAYARNNPLVYVDPTGNTVSLANCQDKNKCVQVLTSAAQLPKGVTAEVDKKGNLVLKGDLSQIKGGNALRLEQLVNSDKTANFWIGDKAPGLESGQTQNISGGLSGTTSQGYNLNFSVVQSDPSKVDSGDLGGVFLNPDGSTTAGQIPGTDIEEAAAHELLGHVWADLIGGESAGTEGNKREALIAEDRVRNTDPSRGLKIRHQRDRDSIQLIKTTDLPRITNPGSQP
jgi:RHS repeat-associated protein